MVEFNKLFRLYRVAAFGVANLFAMIVIILGALILNFSTTYSSNFLPAAYVDSSFPFAALGIATGVFTLLTLPVLLATSMTKGQGLVIVGEIFWIWFLWIMWLSVGASATPYFIGNCAGYSGFGSVVEAVCNESSALAAFGFSACIVLITYNWTLIFLTFRQHSRGHTNVWNKPIADIDFTAFGRSFMIPKLVLPWQPNILQHMKSQPILLYNRTFGMDTK